MNNWQKVNNDVQASGSTLQSLGNSSKLCNRSPDSQGKQKTIKNLRDIHIFIGATNVLSEVLSDGGKLPAVDTNHPKVVYLNKNQRIFVRGKHECTFPNLLRSKRVSPTTWKRSDEQKVWGMKHKIHPNLAEMISSSLAKDKGINLFV